MEDMKFLNVVCFLRRGVVSTSPNTQAGGPPLGGGPCMLIQYIYSHPPHPEAVLLSATWGRAMLWWQGPVYHGCSSYSNFITPVGYTGDCFIVPLSCGNLLHRKLASAEDLDSFPSPSVLLVALPWAPKCCDSEEQSPSWRAVTRLVKKFPTLYLNRNVCYCVQQLISFMNPCIL
jgi:hypothetical protein